ncbi:MAG TPA: hypothetical protein VLM41_01580, partial [Steroidobacteraceae bacterium]|nr:hypothetical protein [Steroidobacteraceae bacterium]
MRTLVRSLPFLAVAMLLGCGAKSPPAGDQPTADGPVAAPAATKADEVYGDPSTPVAGTVLGTVVHTRDAEELRYVVLKQLTDRYAAQNGIVVTPAEKAAYVEHMQAAMRQDRAEKQARRDEVAGRLAAGDVSDEERESLAAERDLLEQFLADTAEDPADNPEEVRAMREQIGGAFILQWKINQALYQQYDGRIIFQQGGPEPLDAYGTFLEEAQARGDFAITDPSLEADFWRYYRDDSIHS